VVGVTFNLVLVVSADNFWLLLGAAMLMVAAANTTQSAWQALIPDQTPATQHGAAAGIKTLWELMGLVMGVTLVGAALARGYLWRAPLTVIGLLWGILAITWYVLGRWGLKETTAHSTAPRASSLWSQPNNRLTPQYVKNAICQRWLAVVALIRAAPGFSWWMVNRFLFLAAGVTVRTFVLNYLHDVLAFSPAEAQSLTSRLTLVLGSGVFLLALPSGAIADRIGRRPLLLIAGVLAAVGAVILVFSRHLPLLYVAAGLIGGGAGIFASSSWALATDLAPKANSALYLGLANSAGVVGSMTGRLGGPLIDGANQLTGVVALGYLLVFGAAALFFAASSVVVLKIPGRH
jgi:MFS family permease